jgi:hypothetical protein
MSTRGQLISNALEGRFRELCDERSQDLVSLRFGGGANHFADRVRQRLLNISPAELTGGVRGHDCWAQSVRPEDMEFRPALFALALGEPLSLASGEHPPVEPFTGLLTAAASQPERRVELLTGRYGCPLNFTLPEEEAVREYVLTRVMSRDRRLIEKNSMGAVNGDDLMVMLNLIAVHATRAPDLRFLDALNYYYELLPAKWYSRAERQAALLASYFALYARSLAAWIREGN